MTNLIIITKITLKNMIIAIRLHLYITKLNKCHCFYQWFIYIIYVCGMYI